MVTFRASQAKRVGIAHVGQSLRIATQSAIRAGGWESWEDEIEATMAGYRAIARHVAVRWVAAHLRATLTLAASAGWIVRFASSREIRQEWRRTSPTSPACFGRPLVLAHQGDGAWRLWIADAIMSDEVHFGWLAASKIVDLISMIESKSFNRFKPEFNDANVPFCTHCYPVSPDLIYVYAIIQPHVGATMLHLDRQYWCRPDDSRYGLSGAPLVCAISLPSLPFAHKH